MTPAAQDHTKAFKSGFIAIVGAPNVGKSTLLNRLLGEKISITSRKPQTTRNRIMGILHHPGSQLIFIDTPGIHRATRELNVRIVDTAIAAIGDVDLVLAVIDASFPDPVAESILLENMKKIDRPVILALNKIDRIEKQALLGLIGTWVGLYSFQAVIPVSAKTGDQVEELVGAMEAALPAGPPFFPEDTLTDRPERFLAGEMIREKVFRFSGQEIPYAAAVTIESFVEGAPGEPVRIHATIHVEKKSQKGIVIGKNGTKLKQIGTEARRDIERMVGKNVYLKLFVRVQKNWSRDTRALRRFGY
jgi:GTP-binding protein Era